MQLNMSQVTVGGNENPNPAHAWKGENSSSEGSSKPAEGDFERRESSRSSD